MCQVHNKNLTIFCQNYTRNGYIDFSFAFLGYIVWCEGYVNYRRICKPIGDIQIMKPLTTEQESELMATCPDLLRVLQRNQIQLNEYADRWAERMNTPPVRALRAHGAQPDRTRRI